MIGNCLIWLTVLWFSNQLPLVELSADSGVCQNLANGECRTHLSDNGAPTAFCSGDVISHLVHNDSIRSLTVCNYPYSDFDVTYILDYYPMLENFTLMSSNVTYIRGRFPPNSSLKVLNLTNLLIEKIRSQVFSSLNALKTLDLRNNHLHHLHPNVINLVNRLCKLYLKGNEWNCGKNLDWVLYLNASIVQDIQNLSCFEQPYPDKPLKIIATLISNLRVECPDPCDCSMPNIVSIPGDRGGGLMPVILVNCSNRGLKKFPELLPQNTTTVLLNGNQIKNVDALVNNRFYRTVADIYLDNNQITSIDELEGAYWLSQFRVLSLKGNKLTQIPTYALDNALQRNHNAVQIFLGHNPWRCDCLFTPSFQVLLVKYQVLMQENLDVRCSINDGDSNSMKPIITLTRSAVCRLPSEYLLNPLDMVNVILASLIILILGKLAFDYYTFKKTGQLPWIVTKMP